MNVIPTAKKIPLGLLALGLTAALLVVPGGTPASAAPSPEIAVLNEAAPDTEFHSPSAAQDEKKRRKGFFLFEDAAAVIGVDKKELKKQLEAGKSIADIAKAKGIGEEDLINRMIAIRNQKIDEAVQSGKWPQDKADRIKQKLPEHLKAMVNKKDWKEWKKDKERHHKKGKEMQSHSGIPSHESMIY
ncbi:MAG: hypothetical protein K0Q94_1468 [Paenibacillus sp.]|jgi:uncharacterized protein YeaC (DUF1315 family)|uniref:hypothetical protein n=1 Tax=Paenibacillus sp. GCM10012303 TaxID=3317340 RepID=UPI0029F3861B|nr:hypothetical protein [Paenibacillus sp.]